MFTSYHALTQKHCNMEANSHDGSHDSKATHQGKLKVSALRWEFAFFSACLWFFKKCSLQIILVVQTVISLLLAREFVADFSRMQYKDMKFNPAFVLNNQTMLPTQNQRGIFFPKRNRSTGVDFD